MTEGRPRSDRTASEPTTHNDTTTMTTTDRHHDARTARQNQADRDRSRTLADVDHTHPDTGRPFGDNVTFTRGQAVAADGGEAGAVPEDEEPETLADVDHTPPNDSEDANRVFERGEEGREEPDPEGAREEDDSDADGGAVSEDE